MKQVKKQPIKQQSKQSREPKLETWQGPIIPAAKVSPEVIEILRTTKVPELIIPSHTTITGAAKLYFDEYLKLFSVNRQLNTDLIETFQERNTLAEKYNDLKQKQQNECDGAIRRKRRFANEIKRDFSCPSPNCHKSYGSQGSLTQHVKLKHESFYKSGEYEILLQNMLDEMVKNNKVKKEEEQHQRGVKIVVKKEETREKKEEKGREKQRERVKDELLVKKETQR